jgi:hypothetical protein
VSSRAGRGSVGKIKSSCSSRESNFGCPSRSLSLYRLSYPGSFTAAVLELLIVGKLQETSVGTPKMAWSHQVLWKSVSQFNNNSKGIV